MGLKSPRAAVVPLTSLATSPRSRSHLRAASLPIICETGPTPLDSPLWGLPRVSASADYSLCSDRKAAAAFADLLKASKQHSTTKQAGASPQVDVAQLRQQHPFPVSHSQKPTQFQAQELSQDQMQSEDQQAPGAIRTQSLRGGRVSSGSDSDSCSDSSSDKPESPTRPSSLKVMNAFRRQFLDPDAHSRTYVTRLPELFVTSCRVCKEETIEIVRYQIKWC